MDDPNLDAEEVFCNQVAAEVLVPQRNFLEMINSTDFTLSIESVSKVARGYGVSEEVIMRRLLDFNKISKSEYEKFRTATREKWENKKEEKSKAIVPYPRRVLGAN